MSRLRASAMRQNGYPVCYWASSEALDGTSGVVPLVDISVASLAAVVLWRDCIHVRFRRQAGRSAADVTVEGGVTSGTADALAATAAVSPAPVAALVKGFSAEYSSTTKFWVVRHWK